MSTSDRRNSEFVERAVGGDRGALAQLLITYYDDLANYIDRRVPATMRAHVSAEDVLHDTFLRASQAIGRFEQRDEQSLRRWLFTIAVNLVRDRARRWRRHREMNFPASPQWTDAHSSQGGADFLAANQTSPSGRFCRQDNAQRLRVALTRLPDEQQEALRRYYLDNQSLDEIARAMARSKESVRSLCYRGRCNLRALLGHSSMFFSH